MVPLFIIFKNLGWNNTFLPLVIPSFFGNPYFIFLLCQFFKGIPEELSDAARIDGANEFDILFRIIMPLARPALIVVGLLTFMGAGMTIWVFSFTCISLINTPFHWGFNS